MNGSQSFDIRYWFIIFEHFSCISIIPLLQVKHKDSYYMDNALLLFLSASSGKERDDEREERRHDVVDAIGSPPAR